MHRPKPHQSKKINLFELYETPLWVWQWLFTAYPQYREGSILDPSCGRAVMLKHLKSQYKCDDLWGFDIDKSNLPKWYQDKTLRKIHQSHMFVTDYLSYEFKKQRFNNICTNPPFSLSVPFVEKSLNLLHEGGHAVFLQKVSWIGTQKRSVWLQTQPLKEVLIITKRPTWVLENKPNNSSDTVEYAFFVFQKGYIGKPTLQWLGPPDEFSILPRKTTSKKFTFFLGKSSRP